MRRNPPLFLIYTRTTLILALLLSACSSLDEPEDPAEEKLTTVRQIKKSETKKPKNSDPNATQKTFVSTPNLKPPVFKPDEWRLVSEVGGIKSYEKKGATDGIVALRGEAVFQAPIAKIVAALNDEKVRGQWVEGHMEGRVLKGQNSLDRVEYQKTRLPWPFEPRDFVYRAKAQLSKSPKSALIQMSSVEHPDAPVVPSVVRGKILYSHYYLKEISTWPETQVVVEIALDPAGAIPKWVVSTAQRRWPQMTLKNLRKLSEQGEVTIPKPLAEFFD